MKRTVVMIGLVGVLLTGCGESQTEASQDARYRLISSQTIDGYGVRTIQDKETGCQYILTTGNGTSVYPLLNKDGKPICK
ncbi:DUF6440 family protein [Bacillus xiapuensis]|uniref:DUF6440 family protein n=1 Tax=Bacillus xiapuensis TaxID=2014075 RepID=A0ABU6N7Z7_9BACI|nr:DUF6440 family protein [Bacillus xiapuensis]